MKFNACNATNPPVIIAASDAAAQLLHDLALANGSARETKQVEVGGQETVPTSERSVDESKRQELRTQCNRAVRHVPPVEGRFRRR